MSYLRTEMKLTQVQKLAMTQTLRQQLEILQMPSLELDELISTELSENPLLEVKENSLEPAVESENESSSEEQLADSTDDDYEDDPLDILKEIDEDIGTNLSTKYKSEDDWQPENPNPETLATYLLFQLDSLDLSQALQSAVVYIIYSLDRHGLISLSFNELKIGWGDSSEILSDALKIIQKFDPPGVAQFSAREALLFQIKFTNAELVEKSLEYKIIDTCFEELAERRVLVIASKLGVTAHEVELAIERIKEFNPWPGSQFAGSIGSVVIPDIIIENHNGKFIVFLNDNRFPHLSISVRNRRVLESPSSDVTEKKYVKKKFRKASWFIKAIRQRQETVSKIAHFIAETQQEFLLHGIDALRPLTLQEAAKALGFNQSTISRAINGKYVQSPQGVHELRYYFSRGSADVSVTAVSVKEEIKRIIDGEDESKPLSDERIAFILNSNGTQIKRRTVANYRKQMDIPGARKRRRF